MADSNIEWTDKTWNPTRGCAIVSPGCVRCYAMKQAHRFSGPGKAYHGLTKLVERSGPQWWTGKVVTVGRTKPWSHAVEWRPGRLTLTPDAAAAIRRRRDEGALLRTIASEFGILTTHAHRLCAETGGGM